VESAFDFLAILIIDRVQPNLSGYRPLARQMATSPMAGQKVPARIM
jgi:hypothetical protein